MSDMRAEFQAWVQDCGCDTDGAWSAWQGCWNRRAAPPVAALSDADRQLMAVVEAAKEWHEVDLDDEAASLAATLKLHEALQRLKGEQP